MEYIPLAGLPCLALVREEVPGLGDTQRGPGLTQSRREGWIGEGLWEEVTGMRAVGRM